VRALLKAVFTKPEKDRSGLRSISTTSPDGVTRVIESELFKMQAFRDSAMSLREFAERVVVHRNGR